MQTAIYCLISDAKWLWMQLVTVSSSQWTITETFIIWRICHVYSFLPTFIRGNFNWNRKTPRPQRATAIQISFRITNTPQLIASKPNINSQWMLKRHPDKQPRTEAISRFRTFAQVFQQCCSCWRVEKERDLQYIRFAMVINVNDARIPGGTWRSDILSSNAIHHTEHWSWETA